MGEIKLSPPAKLICGLLAGDRSWLDRGKEALIGHFGSTDRESRVIPFDFTSYYEKELGSDILRQYVSFEGLVPPGKLASIKVTTNWMEEQLSEGGVRKVNIDPGYLDLSKMVLATTKDATYRVYLTQGISAQSTLFFRDGTFNPWEWTYPDYQVEVSIVFFNQVRGVYKKQLEMLKVE